MPATTNSRTWGALPGLLLTALVAGFLAIGPAAPSSAAPGPAVHDGSSQERAAASCWEIKQADAAAADGTYWLVTPQLAVPTQFYCDMTTDGGGWVLLGRGRENWMYDYNGKGTPEQVASTVTGTAAFPVRQLDANVVNGLLGGRRFDSFRDGVRVRRAADAAGTSWQEVRFVYKSRDRWTWAFGAGQPIASYDIGGSKGTNSSTRDFGSTSSGSSPSRVWTSEDSRNQYVRGFTYGTSVKGSTSSSSYLYSKNADGSWATPFAQVFIRPTITTADMTYQAVPDGGTPQQQARAIPENGALAGAWGVTGLGNGGTSENASEVQAFAQIGDTMYVGGNFTTVQKGASATGSDKVAQSYLAAFDARTGDWISSFRPTLNSQVKSLSALPGGRLAVGGEFTRYNGGAHTGLVVIDPSTGELDPAWTTTLENRVGGGSTVSVRALDHDDEYLYVGGAFSHFVKGATATYARNGARIKLSTMIADAAWNPEFNGTVAALDISDDTSRVYYAGYFTTSKGATADRAAAISTASGAAQARSWKPTFSTTGSARYQQAVREVGDKVWLGGSQHSMFAYAVDTMALVKAHITKDGGDLQAITDNGQVVYGSCHCDDWTFSDTTGYDNLTPGATNVNWSQADKIYTVGAWDVATGDYVPDFTPELKSRQGLGGWALKVGDDGTLWAGGTYQSVVKENGANQWAGGFIRFAQRPTTVPEKPSDLDVTLVDGAANVAWSASGTAGVTYEVLRNDRVVASTASTSVDVPDSAPGDRFFVRTSDGRGNRSASTAVRIAPAPIQTQTLLEAGSIWTYSFDSAAPPAEGWQEASFDADSWKSGAAPLGYGTHASIVTSIDVPAGQTRPLTSYYRSTFEADPSAYSEVRLTTRADDGVVVYVNGQEVGRANMPSGAVGVGTYALSAVGTAAALADPVTIDVPHSALVAGTNTIAVEVHANYRAAKDVSMDASITATLGTPPPPPADVEPEPPAGPAALVEPGSTWSYLFDNAASIPADWTTSAARVDDWTSGAAPFGYGTHSSLVTNIDVPAGQTRPLTSYYRRDFEVADPGAIDRLLLETRADDGVVVYLNGVEVVRSNMPSGAVGPGTYATSAVGTAVALAAPVVAELPSDLLVAGTNTIAVEVHANYRAAKDVSMDLTLTGEA